MSLALRRKRTEFIDAVQAHAFTHDFIPSSLHPFIPRLVDVAAGETGTLGGSLWRIDAHSVIDDVDCSTPSLGLSVHK